MDFNRETDEFFERIEFDVPGHLTAEAQDLQNTWDKRVTDYHDLRSTEATLSRKEDVDPKTLAAIRKECLEAHDREREALLDLVKFARHNEVEMRVMFHNMQDIWERAFR